ncbi:MAG: hypothetical protein ACI9G1_005760 [Pirellulaceae bacterium]|jgi:hypothetical protein
MTRTILLTLLLLSPAAQLFALDEAEFARLHKQLQPSAEEGWSSIPWKTSLVQACVQAAREKKPLFMVCRAGHPLGCV